ncbi:MAG: prepilin-type N-terminal cleavage/methylation domain-containing protein [Magnetococcus sp. DMHC-6]
MLNKNFGFTLIDLVIAMVIVAILAMFAIPAYNQYIQQSRRGDAYATLEMIALAQEQWRSTHTTYGTLANVWPQGGSKGGFYTITIGMLSATTYLVTATATSTQSNDYACKTIQLDQNGPVVTSNAQKACWNK